MTGLSSTVVERAGDSARINPLARFICLLRNSSAERSADCCQFKYVNQMQIMQRAGETLSFVGSG